MMPNAWKKFKIPLIFDGLGLYNGYQHQICFLKRLVNTVVYQDVQDNFPIPYIKDKLWDNEFIF